MLYTGIDTIQNNVGWWDEMKKKKKMLDNPTSGSECVEEERLETVNSAYWDSEEGLCLIDSL